MNEEQLELAAAANKALSALTLLNYDQKQIANDHEYKAVFDQICRQRRIADGLLILAAIALTYRVVTGLIESQWHMWSAMAMFLAIFWLWKRQAATRATATVIERFESSRQPDTETPPLVVELKLHQQLTYEQRQRLKSDEVVEVAREIARTRKANGMTLIIGVWPASAYFLIRSPDLNGPEASLQSFIISIATMFVFAIVLIGVGTVAGIRERRIAEKLNCMISDYEETRTRHIE